MERREDRSFVLGVWLSIAAHKARGSVQSCCSLLENGPWRLRRRLAAWLSPSTRRTIAPRDGTNASARSCCSTTLSGSFCRSPSLLMPSRTPGAAADDDLHQCGHQISQRLLRLTNP